jgi:hypothetical protein
VEEQKRSKFAHRNCPLSEKTRRRLLASMLERAEAGDMVAATSLVLISLRLENLESVQAYRQEASPA